MLQQSVDGDVSTCFTTARETNPWWLVDLGAEYVVYGITLATSQDQTGSNQPRDVKVTQFNMGASMERSVKSAHFTSYQKKK